MKAQQNVVVFFHLHLSDLSIRGAAIPAGVQIGWQILEVEIVWNGEGEFCVWGILVSLMTCTFSDTSDRPHLEVVTRLMANQCQKKRLAKRQRSKSNFAFCLKRWCDCHCMSTLLWWNNVTHIFAKNGKSLYFCPILYLVLMYVRIFMLQNKHWRCSEKLRTRWPVEVARQLMSLFLLTAKMLDPKDWQKCL